MRSSVCLNPAPAFRDGIPKSTKNMTVNTLEPAAPLEDGNCQVIPCLADRDPRYDCCFRDDCCLISISAKPPSALLNMKWGTKEIRAVRCNIGIIDNFDKIAFRIFDEKCENTFAHFDNTFADDRNVFVCQPR